MSAVETSALNNRFEPVPGTAEVVDCDTVLFAAGLIPELETVKPAGVRLPDGFHPEINTFFETNVPGLFAAGNCLHINDLADTAAEEGLKTAESVVKYLADSSTFRSAASEAPQACLHRSGTANRIQREFFKQISDEGLTVCIICPQRLPA